MRSGYGSRGMAIASALAALGFSIGGQAAEGAQLDPCTAISPGSLSAYAQVVAAAHKWAAADASANGTSGRYAVAATNSRDQLKAAYDRTLSAIADLRKSGPSVTTAAEAGTIKEHIRYILQLVPQAAHWAIISEVYHDSPDARKAFEGSIEVLKRGNELYAETSRCYMNGL